MMENKKLLSKTWFIVLYTIAGAFVLIGAIVANASLEFILSQAFLWLSTLAALAVLDEMNFVNPIQTIVFINYWHFAIGPGYTGLIGNPKIVDVGEYLSRGSTTVTLLGFGQVVYAACSVLGYRICKARNWYIRSLQPHKLDFETRNLTALLMVGFGADLIISLLGLLGVVGIETVGFLGGKLTTVWWIGVLDTLVGILRFGLAALAWYALRNWSQISKSQKGTFIALFGWMFFSNLLSGWKGAAMQYIALILFPLCTIYQRPPLKFIGFAVSIFSLIVFPLVTNVRVRCEIEGVTDSRDRIQVCWEELPNVFLLKRGNYTGDNDPMLSSFRGIFTVATEVVLQSSAWYGCWEQNTIVEGLLANVPRALFSGKPNMDIGNYFARTIGVDVGISEVDNFDFNICVSIPFEVIGNHGIVAGIASFGFFGLAWTTLCCLVLTPDRLHSHPFQSVMILTSQNTEAALGAFVAVIRGMAIQLLAVSIILRAVGNRIRSPN